VEFRFGLNPTEPDTLVDHDFDGELSGKEIQAGTNPIVLDEDNMLLNKMVYSITQGSVGPEETRCYEFKVQNITLVPTLNLPDEDSPKGTNRIYIYAGEEPVNSASGLGIYHVACVEARYLGETYKNPSSGKIPKIPPERFVEAALFDPELHCVRTGEDPNVFPDGGMP
jgi:hypothetical protein